MGVLTGVRVLELAAIGPVPWASMLLADMGADVLRIDRPGADATPAPSMRGRTTVQLDLKTAAGLACAHHLVRGADVLLEGMRPRALEQLGLGPETCLQLNPSLILGRMTGWGQSGPLAERAGHDINYIALTGVLHAIGRDKPVPPLNLVADYGGGGAFLLIGVLSALLAARQTGNGRVVDAAMIDGSASMMTVAYERMMQGRWCDQRGVNALDGGAPWYDVYETKDGRYVAVGCIEPQFYELFLAGLGLDRSAVPDRADRANWPALRTLFADCLAARTRDEWTAVFESTDACVTPVLSMTEAPDHPHNIARGVFRDFAGNMVPGPAPRFGVDAGTMSGTAVAVLAEDAVARWAERPTAVQPP